MKLILHIGLLLPAIFGKKTYYGKSVLRVKPDTEEQARVLTDILLYTGVDIWHIGHGPNTPFDFRVNADELEKWKEKLNNHGMQASIMIEDVQRLIDTSTGGSESITPKHHLYDLETSRYQTLDEIYTWLSEINTQCGSECALLSLGVSHEGRDLPVIRIGSGETGRRKVWVDGGIHAREWIAPAVANYIIERLILHKDDADIAPLREAFDWYIQPVVNPDGYEYSWTTDRLWRKTRTLEPESGCYGTDGNRNYDFMWGGVGTSDDPCSLNFRGPSPASEVEISQLQDFILAQEGNFDLLLALHSYTQVIIHPWGYTDLEDPPNYAAIVALAEVGVNAMSAVHNMDYGVRRSTNSGIATDWALGVAGIPHAYVVELRDKGEHGFLLPEDQILPCSEEIWAGVVAMATQLI